MASWAELNKTAGGSTQTTPSAAQSGGWASANARALQSLGGAKQIGTIMAERQAANQAIEEAAIASRDPNSQTPFIRGATISAPPVSDKKFQILGVTINRPTSLYGTESGQPIIDVDPSRFEVRTNEKSNFLQRGIAAVANTVAQGVFAISNAFSNRFDVMLVDNVTKGKDISLGADGTPVTSEGTPILLPQVRERLEQGKPAQPTTAEKVGAVLDIGTSIAGASFTPISAQLAAAEELPVIGKPIFGKINKGFELLDHASRFVGGKAVDLLPVSDDSKAVLRRPIEDLAGIVGTLFGVKAIHVAGQRGGGRVVEALPVSEATKGKIRGGVQLSAGIALDPFGTAYRGMVSSIQRKVSTRTTKGEEITPEVAETIVNEVVKEVKTPEIQAIMEVPTREGKTRVYTNQKIVLENLIRNRENLNYRRVDDLGISLQTKQPITSRFEWDYAKQQGTIYTTDKTTSVDLAHELGHYVDRQLGAAVSVRLSDVLPEYTTNRDKVNQMLADYALDRLGGNATHAEINAEIVKIADNIRQEVQTSRSQAERRKPAEEFAASVSDIINDPLRRKQSPELAQLIEFSLGGDALRKGGKVDIAGEPGSLAETKSVLDTLEGSRRDMIKKTRADDQTFAELRLAEDMKRQAVIERGEVASANFDWQDIARALKDSKVFKKEGSLDDRTIDGVLMARNGKYRVVAFEDVKKMQRLGWESRFSMDKVAQSNGFESAEEYAYYVLELDAEMRTISRSSEQRAAHEYLMKNDPNYANLNKTIDVLREQLTSAEEAIRTEKQGSAENQGRVPSEQKAQESVENVSTKVLNEVNPTGSVFVDYKATERAQLPLGSDMTTLASTEGKPSGEMVTIYRGAPKSQTEINPGDFVTTNKQLAKDYAGNGHVISKEVRLGDVLDSKSEPLGEEYIYRPNADKELAPKTTQVESRGTGIPKNPEPKRIEREQGTGERQGTSKVGQSIARKTIEQKLEDSYKGTAEYDRINIKDQARRVEELINGDLERAKRVMTGEEALPDGMRVGALIKGLEEYALKTGDADLAFELANSPLVAETSLYAQEMRLLAERSPDSATARVRELRKVREEAAKEAMAKNQSLEREVKGTKQELQEIVKKNRPKKEDWTSFIDSIKCT